MEFTSNDRRALIKGDSDGNYQINYLNRKPAKERQGKKRKNEAYKINYTQEGSETSENLSNN